MISRRRIRPIIKKEFRQIFRDKRSLGVLLFIPAFMLIMFGYALNYDVRHVPLAVFDQDGSTMSREFMQQFIHSEYFDFARSIRSERQIDSVIPAGVAHVVLVIPPKFSDDLLANRSVSVQVLVDGANATTAATAAGYLAVMTQNYSTNLSIKALQRAGIGKPVLPIDYRPRVWFNPELASAKFMVPGLIGFILMMSTVVSTSLSIVREKERGQMEQISVSPIHPLELLIGKMAPYVVISLFGATLILLTGYILFDVVVKGSLFLLFIETSIFTLCGLGLGMWVSTISKKQDEAFQLATLVSFLPTFLLSGFTFPIANMPKVIQWITVINPSRYFLFILRSIILKGVGLNILWEPTLFMLLFAIFIMAVSWNKMRKSVFRS